MEEAGLPPLDEPDKIRQLLELILVGPLIHPSIKNYSPQKGSETGLCRTCSLSVIHTVRCSRGRLQCCVWTHKKVRHLFELQR